MVRFFSYIKHKQVVLHDKLNLKTALEISCSNRPDRVVELADHWAGIPKVLGSIPTVARHIFQLACMV